MLVVEHTAPVTYVPSKSGDEDVFRDTSNQVANISSAVSLYISHVLYQTWRNVL